MMPNNFTIFLIVLIVFANFANTKVFICNEERTKIVEFELESSFCDIHTEPYDVHNILMREKEVMIVDDNTLDAIEERCYEKEKYGFIFPGTLWCGKGSKAQHFQELGIHEEEDKCCREHDHCKNTLKSGECRGNVCNESPYTRSHCDCDIRFQTCLKNVHTVTANIIGSIFFNIARIQCFNEYNCDENEMYEIGKFDYGRCIEFKSNPKYYVPIIKQTINFFGRALRKFKLG